MLNLTILLPLWARQPPPITSSMSPSLFKNNKCRKASFLVGLLNTCDKKLSSTCFRNFPDFLVTAVRHSKLMSGKLKTPARTRAIYPQIPPNCLQNKSSVLSYWLGDGQQTRSIIFALFYISLILTQRLSTTLSLTVRAIQSNLSFTCNSSTLVALPIPPQQPVALHPSTPFMGLIPPSLNNTSEITALGMNLPVHTICFLSCMHWCTSNLVD